MLRLLGIAVCVLGLMSLVVGTVPGAVTYTITDLNPAGASASQAMGIDANGDVVGYCTVGSATHGFYYTPAGSIVDPGVPAAWTPPADYPGTIAVGSVQFLSVARNAATGNLQMVGNISYTFTQSGGGQIPQVAPVLYDATAHQWTVFPNLINPLVHPPTAYPATYSQNNTGQSANGLNAAGQIAGAAANPGLVMAPFLYTGATNGYGEKTATNIGALPGGYSGGKGTANGIDANGDVVMRGYNTSNQLRAMLYLSSSPSSLIDLGTLTSGTASTANAIARSGNTIYVAGYSSGQSTNPPGTSGQQDTVFVVDATSGTVTTRYGYGYGSSGAFLYGVNGSGTAVGFDGLSAVMIPLAATARTNLYDTSLVTNLAGSGFTSFSSARAINDAGAIVGIGFAGTPIHAFLLTPVPEPSAFLLVVTAAFGLMAYAWRKWK